MKELNFGVKAIAAELDRHGCALFGVQPDEFHVRLGTQVFTVGYNAGGGYRVVRVGSTEPVRVYKDVDCVVYYLLAQEVRND